MTAVTREQWTMLGLGLAALVGCWWLLAPRYSLHKAPADMQSIYRLDRGDNTVKRILVLAAMLGMAGTVHAFPTTVASSTQNHLSSAFSAFWPTGLAAGNYRLTMYVNSDNTGGEVCPVFVWEDDFRTEILPAAPFAVPKAIYIEVIMRVTNGDDGVVAYAASACDWPSDYTISFTLERVS
jgi:hypothetical protein